MTDPVKLKGSLPGNDIKNGLWDLHRDLADHPRRKRVAVITFDVITTTTDHEVTEDGEAIPVHTCTRCWVQQAIGLPCWLCGGPAKR